LKLLNFAFYDRLGIKMYAVLIHFISYSNVE
jgi:hypothetical protein